MESFQSAITSLTIPCHVITSYFTSKSLTKAIDVKFPAELMTAINDSDAKTNTIAISTDEELFSLFNEQNSISSNKNIDDYAPKYKTKAINKSKFQLYGLCEKNIQTNISFGQTKIALELNGLSSKKLNCKRINPEIKVANPINSKKYIKDNNFDINAKTVPINKLLIESE